MKINIEVKKMKIGSSRPTSELTKTISKLMYDHTQDAFKNEGPGWTPLSKRTVRQRISQGFGEGPILDRKMARQGLRLGIVENNTATKAEVGPRKGILYAAIHQFGGVINRIVKPGKVSLRTDRKGKLLRNKDYKNLAIFANKKTHKLKKVIEYSGGKPFKITIPQRKYLFFSPQLVSDIKKAAVDFFKS